RHQLRVRSDEGVVFDDGLGLVHAVVVAGNGTGAYVYTLANDRIADIGQVIGLGTLAQLALLDFHEIADMSLSTDVGAGTPARIGPYASFICDLRFLDMAEGLDMRAGADNRVFDDAVRTDADAVGQLDHAFENASDVNIDIAPAFQRTAHVESGRISQRHALLQQPPGLFALPV